jgi:hypothetical protein
MAVGDSVHHHFFLRHFMRAVITFDLGNADADKYRRAYEILRRLGLLPVSLHNHVDLPTTTVMGELNVTVGAEALRDFIQDEFVNAGIKPAAIFGGVLEDWAVVRSPA